MAGTVPMVWGFTILAGFLMPVLLVASEIYSGHLSTRQPRRQLGRLVLCGIGYAAALVASLCLAVLWTGWLVLFAMLVLAGIGFLLYAIVEAIGGNRFSVSEHCRRISEARFETNEHGSLEMAAGEAADKDHASDERTPKSHKRQWRGIRMGRYGLWK